MKYISSLISGVAIFCVGTGFSFYHGISGLSSTEVSSDFFWAYVVLIGSFCFESVTLGMAIMSIRNSSKQANQSFMSYVTSGQDPCVNVVLFEDTAAVAGAAVAAVCIGLTQYLNNPVPDAVGSLLVGVMLGAVAMLVIYTSVPALVGRSIKLDQLDKINAELESDAMIKAIHDVKGIDMGNSMIRYKAEIDFNGRELTRNYLEKHNVQELWQVRSFIFFSSFTIITSKQLATSDSDDSRPFAKMLIFFINTYVLFVVEICRRCKDFTVWTNSMNSC